MPLPPQSVRPPSPRVGRYCDERVLAGARSEIRNEHAVRGSAITIVDRRPPWSELVGLTGRRPRLRSCATTPGWTLYSSDSSDRCWVYDDADPAPDVGPLLAAIDEDPTGIFWD